MDISTWIPAVVTSGGLGLAIWLGRNLILTRLKASVEHEFNERLEHLRGQLRQSEESFRADLRGKEAELSTLRSGAMGALANRLETVAKKRVEAVDALWRTAHELKAGAAANVFMATIKKENLLERLKRDSKLKAFVEQIGKTLDMKAPHFTATACARPYVTAMAWATFSAYRVVSMHGATRAQMVLMGVDIEELDKEQSIVQIVAAVLPHQKAFLEKWGYKGFYHLVDELEARLLAELQAMLRGTDDDRTTVDQAAEILRLVGQASRQQQSVAIQPTGE
jgi:hypothetical protein